MAVEADRKHEIDQFEVVADVSQKDNKAMSDMSLQEQKMLTSRIDKRLVVTCEIMFSFSLMDRTNLGAASIAGMSKELKLVEYRYVRLHLP